MGTNWTALDNKKLEICAKYFAMLEFVALDYKVFEPESDHTGVDFIARRTDGLCLKLQVVPIRQSSIILKRKCSWKLRGSDPHIYAMILLFINGILPEPFLIPALAWKFPNDLLIKDTDQKLNLKLDNRSIRLLEKYGMVKILKTI
jgi:hypothetical protein